MPRLAKYEPLLRTHLGHRVPAELAQRLGGQHPGHHRLGHHAHGGHSGTSVRSLNDTVSSLVTTSTVFRTGRLRVASGFMHTGDDGLAVGNPAFDAAGVVGLPPVGLVLGVPCDRVVRRRAAAPGHLDALADLDRLYGMDAHERLGQEPVDLAVPVHVAAQPHRYPIGDHFDDSSRASRRPWPPP